MIRSVQVKWAPLITPLIGQLQKPLQKQPRSVGTALILVNYKWYVLTVEEWSSWKRLFSRSVCVFWSLVDYLSPCRWRRTGLEDFFHPALIQRNKTPKAIWLKTFKSHSLHITTLAPSSLPLLPSPGGFSAVPRYHIVNFSIFHWPESRGGVRKLFLWLISTFQKDVWDFKMRGQRDHYYASSVKVLNRSANMGEDVVIFCEGLKE